MTEKEPGIGGRKAIPIEYIDVDYKGLSYTIGTITKLDGTTIKFIIDSEDKEKVIERNWHCGTGGLYISSVFRTTDGAAKALYLHNLIMDRLTFDGKGTTESVDHINGMGTDNRKENLRICSQSQQNRNRSKRERTTTRLPDGIDPEEIPQNIWYMPPNGAHGDRFAIEIKGIPETSDITWRSTSSKSVTTREKLQAAIKKRNELYSTITALRDHERESELSKRLLAEYNELIKI